MSVCATCKRPIKYEEDIRCCICSNIFHNHCVKISETTEATNESWACSRCREVDNCTKILQDDASLTVTHFKMIMEQLSSPNTSISQCKNSLSETNAILKTHSEKLAQQGEEINNLKSENAMLREKLSSLEKKSTLEIDSTFQEFRDRVCRKNNLIVTGVAESSSDDNTIIQEIFKSLDLEKQTEILSTRLGKESPRPIKVILSNNVNPLDILKKKPLLNKSLSKSQH